MTIFLKIESGWAVMNKIAKRRKQIAKCLKKGDAKEKQGVAS